MWEQQQQASKQAVVVVVVAAAASSNQQNESIVESEWCSQIYAQIPQWQIVHFFSVPILYDGCG